MIKKIRPFQIFFLFVSLLLASGGVFAVDGVGPGSDKLSFLTPPITDKSISYLSQLFGNVGTVLHGTSGQLLAKAFEIFNLGILVIASTFATYTVFRSVLSTAQDGEFMGKQQKSMWVSIRTCLGVGFLAPVFGGYSAIQVLMMWIVVHGVGFADAAWSKALTYMRQGGQIYVAPQDEQVRAMLDKSAYMLKAMVCTLESKKMSEQLKKEAQEAKEKGLPQPSQGQGESGQIFRSYEPSFDPVANNVFNFPGGVGSQYAPDKCGSVIVEQGAIYDWAVEWSRTPEDPGQAHVADGWVKLESFSYKTRAYHQQGCTDAANATRKIAQEQGWTLTGARNKLIDNVYSACIDRVKSNEGGGREGITQMMLDLNPIAQDMVSKDPEEPPKSEALNKPSQAVLSDKVVASLIAATADFINITMPQRAKAVGASNQQSLDAYYRDAINSGWVTAGAFYYDLGKMQREIDNNAQRLVRVGKDMPTKDQLTKNFGFSDAIVQHTFTLFSNIGTSRTDAGTYIKAAFDANEAMNTTNKMDLPKISVPLDFGFMVAPANNMFTAWRDLFSITGGNPINGLQKLGFTNMDIAVALYTGTTLLAGLLGIAGTMIMGSGNASITLDIFLTILPMIIFFASTLFATGAVFALYVPLIPYILFTFGAIGWIIVVVEGMVAAPLVALGVTHPEGHDLMGKSEQAIMLMLGVFLRPVLMIIGMLGGMILSYVGFRMINLGFNMVSSGMMRASGGITLIIIQIIVEIIYATVVISVVNQAYSLIYIVPDRVLRWIGAPDQALGKPEAISKIEQGSTEAGKEMGGKISEAQRGAQDVKKIGKGIREDARDEGGAPAAKTKKKT